MGASTLMVRTSHDPSALAALVRETIRSLDRDLAVYNVATMDATLATAVERERFASLLLGSFAVVALFLAALGVYGVLSYLVAQRRHEVGVRMALGASSTSIVRLVVTQGLTMTVIGLVGGIIAALACRG